MTEQTTMDWLSETLRAVGVEADVLMDTGMVRLTKYFPESSATWSGGNLSPHERLGVWCTWELTRAEFKVIAEVAQDQCPLPGAKEHVSGK